LVNRQAPNFMRGLLFLCIFACGKRIGATLA
jgi:hypothetical protein